MVYVTMARKGAMSGGLMHTSRHPKWWINQINQAWPLRKPIRATLETIVHVLAHGESYQGTRY